MEVIHFIHGYLVLLATDSVIKSSSSEAIFSKIGSNATLECPWTEDSVKWYGIYGHQYSSGNSILSSLPSSLRARLDIWENDGYNLRITNVSGYDEGQYKCSSSNDTTFILMYLSAPPTSVSFQNLVKQYINGNEGQVMNITCKSVGGQPPPSLLLSRKGDLLAKGDNGTLLYTFQPSRIDDMSSFTCTANHSELKVPLNVVAVLYLNLKTESIRMENIPTLYEFDVLNASCFATGGRPPTSFQWNLHGEYYNSSYEDIENVYPTDTYNVKSVLSLQISRNFDNRKLACIAFDSVGKTGIIRSQTLEIYYSPSIHIVYQNLTVDDNITQFICQPHGNPIIYKYYQWEHHSAYGEKIRTFDSVLDGSLNIPQLERTHRYQDTGIYKCFAENGIADKTGNKIQSGSVFFVNNGKPKVSTINPSNQFCKLGGVGLLVVRYLSWPPPTNFTWLKYEDSRNIKLYASEIYTIIETEAVINDYFHDKKIHVDGYIGILHINEVTLTDFTNYTVLIQNEYGLEVFTIFLNDISKYEDPRTNNGTKLFYGGPAVILTIFLTTGVLIALFLWKKRTLCRSRSRQKEYKQCGEINKDEYNDTQDVMKGEDLYYDGAAEHLHDLLATPTEKRNKKTGKGKQTPTDVDDESISEDYTYPDAEIETTISRNPSLSSDLDVKPKPPNIFSRTHDNSDVQRRRIPPPIPDTKDVERRQLPSPVPNNSEVQTKRMPSTLLDNSDVQKRRLPSPIPDNTSVVSCSDESDYTDTGPVPPPLLPCRSSKNYIDDKHALPLPEEIHQGLDHMKINEACSLATSNEGYNPEEENNGPRRSLPPPPVHQPHDEHNGIGSKFSVKDDGPMSSSPYACYSCKANEASASIRLPTEIRPVKLYYDHYSAKSMDSWKQPIIIDKTLDADNEETFKMETDTQEEEKADTTDDEN
ncbi:uncharacterized protein LOC143085381 isoform X2 [Mytilus galloprovincialis]|uniref:uncharacterized protein LOC143085381 isoform X2 n=1 Tax=Mytilus galloprovincialis TaxID=29158 RepID=UPI003F7C2556